MKRHELPAGKGGRGLLLLLLLGALLLAASAGVLARQQPDAPDAEAVLPHLASEKPRFYITNFNASAANADTVCAAGYHMASIWEILDPGERTYARNVGAAYMRADQGSGPVAGWWGWVRTGNDASVANVAGTANCANWTSSTAGQYGTIVKLADNWTTAGVAISPWQAQAWACNGIAPVWCASDPVYGSFLPFMGR